MAISIWILWWCVYFLYFAAVSSTPSCVPPVLCCIVWRRNQFLRGNLCKGTIKLPISHLNTSTGNESLIVFKEIKHIFIILFPIFKHGIHNATTIGSKILIFICVFLIMYMTHNPIKTILLPLFLHCHSLTCLTVLLSFDGTHEPPSWRTNPRPRPDCSSGWVIQLTAHCLPPHFFPPF